MLSKILSLKNIHPSVLVSTTTNLEAKNPEEEHSEVSDWHFPSNDLKKYSVSIPLNSQVISAIRNSGNFKVGFLDRDKFDHLVKAPLFIDEVASIQCKAEKEMQVADSIVFTGRIVNFSFTHK